MELSILIKVIVVICTLMLLLMVSIVGFGIIALRSYFNYKQMKLELKRYEIDCTTFPYGENVVEYLQKFIEDCFDDYMVNNLIPDRDGNIIYVDDEKEIKIRNELSKIVSSRLPPVLLERLSFYYNSRELGNVIAEKIYFVVMDYAIQSRKMREDTYVENIIKMPNEVVS